MNYAGYEELRAGVAALSNEMCDLRTRLNELESGWRGRRYAASTRCFWKPTKKRWRWMPPFRTDLTRPGNPGHNNTDGVNMMYGTRKEVTRLIKRAFGGEEKLALLVWTEQDLMAQAEDMTAQEADAILCAIGNAGLYDHMEEGISSRRVRELLAGLRAGRETVTLDAGLLARVMRTAEHALSSEDGAAWATGAGTPAAVRDGLADIARVRALLAA